MRDCSDAAQQQSAKRGRLSSGPCLDTEKIGKNTRGSDRRYHAHGNFTSDAYKQSYTDTAHPQNSHAQKKESTTKMNPRPRPKSAAHPLAQQVPNTLPQPRNLPAAPSTTYSTYTTYSRNTTPTAQTNKTRETSTQTQNQAKRSGREEERRWKWRTVAGGKEENPRVSWGTREL